MTQRSMHQLQQEMDRFFNNSGGGGIAYGGTSPGYGPITGGGSGGGGGGAGGGAQNPKTPQPSKDKLPYNPGDYRYHDYTPGADVHYNGRWYNEDGGKHRCDGWVIHKDPIESFPLPPCPKPIGVSWIHWDL